METPALRERYEKLTDEELLRVWADKDGVAEVAFSLLTEEMRKRRLLNDPQAAARVKELKQELADNKKRYERGQRRIVRRVRVIVGVVAVAVLAAIVTWLFSK